MGFADMPDLGHIPKVGGVADMPYHGLIPKVGGVADMPYLDYGTRNATKFSFKRLL